MTTGLEATRFPSSIQARKLFGLPVHALTMSESVRFAEAAIDAGRARHHVVVNAAKVVRAQHDPDLRRVIENAALVNADGMAVVWASRLLGAPVPERVAGIDYMMALLAVAERRGWGVYFLGATEETNRRAVDRAKELHPQLRVVGRRDGYWQPGAERCVVAAVRDARPRLLLLALPTPQKELFAYEHLDALGADFVVGVGGSFDVLAGITKRAPLWMQRAGLEWFHRLLCEPRRMWRRYLVGNCRFVTLTMRELLRR